MVSNTYTAVVARVGPFYGDMILTEEALIGVAKERDDMWYDKETQSLMWSGKIGTEVSLKGVPACKDAVFSFKVNDE